jgi:hypothetical protein
MPCLAEIQVKTLEKRKITYRILIPIQIFTNEQENYDLFKARVDTYFSFVKSSKCAKKKKEHSLICLL